MVIVSLLSKFVPLPNGRTPWLINGVDPNQGPLGFGPNQFLMEKQQFHGDRQPTLQKNVPQKQPAFLRVCSPLVSHLPSLKLTFSPLKMDGWNTILSY